jgi:hypothetical protein
VAGRIRSIEKFSDFIGNRTRDLPASSHSASTNSATARQNVKVNEVVHVVTTVLSTVALK